MKIIVAYTNNIIPGKTVEVVPKERISVSWGELQNSATIGYGALQVEGAVLYLHYSGKPFQGYPSIVAEYDDETNELDVLFVSISNNRNQDPRIKKVIYNVV